MGKISGNIQYTQQMETVHSTQTLSMQVTNHDWISWSRIEKIHTPEDSLHTGLSRQRELKQDRYVQSFTTYPWSNVQDVCIMQFVYFNPQNQMNKCMLSEDFLATHKHKRPPPQISVKYYQIRQKFRAM